MNTERPAAEITAAIIETAAKAGVPFSDEHKMILAASLAIWIRDQQRAAYNEGIRRAAITASMHGSAVSGGALSEKIRKMKR